MKDERGYVLEFILFMSLLFFFIFGILVYSMTANAKGDCFSAARDAARTLAVTHDQSQALARAKDVIQTTLYTGARIGGGNPGDPHTAFDPTNPNPVHPDVVLQDDGTYSRVWVYYHLPNAIPGLPKLLNPKAPALARYITVSGYAEFKDEPN